MRLGKTAVLGLTGVLVSMAFVMPVSAHGHHGNRTKTVCAAETDHLCQVCAEEGCDIEGWHLHDGSTYCGYDHEDGYCDGSCDTVRVCTVDGCTKTGHHTHDGTVYCGYDHESGYCDRSCDTVWVCDVDNCTKTGHHTHDGTAYCGYDHENGYCDGTCEKPKRSAVRRHGRHHGCH